MGRDTPSYDRSVKRRGLGANDGTDPTLASYLSSLLYLCSVPSLVLVAYGGYWTGVWGYQAIIPVFAGLLVTVLGVTLAVMHGRAGR